MEKPVDQREQEYWHGTKNKLIRYYFYCQRGLDLFNNFRYVIMAIFGIYYTLKLKNPDILLGMFLFSIPLLMFIGYWSVHHVGKVIDWLNVKFSTHYSLYAIKLQEEIRDAVQKLVKDGSEVID
jgi:hypothetical protein